MLLRSILLPAFLCLSAMASSSDNPGDRPGRLRRNLAKEDRNLDVKEELNRKLMRSRPSFPRFLVDRGNPGIWTLQGSSGDAESFTSSEDSAPSSATASSDDFPSGGGRNGRGSAFRPGGDGKGKGNAFGHDKPMPFGGNGRRMTGRDGRGRGNAFGHDGKGNAYARGHDMDDFSMPFGGKSRRERGPGRDGKGRKKAVGHSKTAKAHAHGHDMGDLSMPFGGNGRREPGPGRGGRGRGKSVGHSKTAKAHEHGHEKPNEVRPTRPTLPTWPTASPSAGPTPAPMNNDDDFLD